MLPGAPVAEAVLTDLRPRIARLVEAGHVPGLGTILVGGDSASGGYVAMKMAKAAEMDPDKDVDGLHPVNMGRLALGMPGPVPCTPAGIEALLSHHGVEVAGQEVCVLGRGTTLGRPLALLLTQKRPTANAAVTVVHTGVPDWERYTRRAAVVVAAAGVPGILQPEHITPGSTVVGGGVRYEGKRLLPDVDEACNEVAGAITPRVGGVGPTTVAMLFKNCVEAAERRVGLS
jgi:methylenetetrahydrofolate dehydrogenase (NADP+)/methenyltetrahydrofolate cyclohydrolase